MICKYCNREIADHSKFCKYCGSILSEDFSAGDVRNTAYTYSNQPVYNTQYSNVTAPPKKKKKSKVKKVFLILFLTVLILSVIASALIFVFFFPPKDMYYLAETKTVFYYPDGSESEWEYVDNVNGFNTKTSSEYRDFDAEFDKDGRISSLSFEYDDDGDVKKYEFDYSDTDNGSSGNTGDVSNTTYYEAEYNKQNKLVSFVRYEEEKETLRITQEYNFLGHRVYKEEISYDSEEDATYRSISNYDHKGDVTHTETYCQDVLISSYEYEDGEIVKSSRASEYGVEDGSVSITRYTNTTYGENGIPLEITEYDDKNKVIGYTKITEQSDSVLELEFYEEDEFSGRYYIEFNEDGNPTKAKVFDENNKLMQYATQKYDEDGNAIKTEEFDSDGNSQGYITYKYDKHGNCIEEKEYDENGELFCTSEYTYEKKKIINW